MREIGIGLLGVGVVGGGVLKIYEQHRADLEARAGCSLRIVAAVARDVTAHREGLEPAAWPLSVDPERRPGRPGGVPGRDRGDRRASSRPARTSSERWTRASTS